MQKLPVHFWRSSAGREPVREWLSNLSADERRVIGRDIAKVQYGWPMGMPLCRPMGNGLWEVRSSLPSGREARVLFVFVDERLVAVHAFFKTTQKTPASDLGLARQRAKELKP
jgi:phage-related protein